MSNRQEEFFRELLADFKIEAAEHYATISNGILDLEKDITSNSNEVIEVVFRAVHSLKGAARAVNHPDIEQLCQSFENVMSKLKQTSLEPSSNVFNILQNAISTLDLLIRDIGIDSKSYDPLQFEQTILSLDLLANESQQIHSSMYTAVDHVNAPAAFGEKPAIQEMVRISTDKLTKLLSQGEELITTKEVFKNHTLDLKTVLNEFDLLSRSIDANIRLLFENDRSDLSYKDEYTRNQRDISKRFRQRLIQLVKNAENIQRNNSRTTDDLLLDIRRTLLVPFSTRTGIFTKMIRDLAIEQKKEINLIMDGGELEIDRTILEKLNDPLIHILRNAVDHGIESPYQRTDKGKPSMGTIHLIIEPAEDQQVMITITDDGIGISPDKVVSSAIDEGLITADEADQLSGKEKIALVFRSGVSTSTYVTNISGRGLGMAIVAEKVLGLGGNLDIDSIPGTGTKITITVPLTMTTFRGVIIKTSGQPMMVPINSIERVLRVKPGDIHIIKDHESINLEGHPVGLLRLSDVLGIPRKNDWGQTRSHYVIVLTSAKIKLAFIVDQVFSEQEGIVKPMGSQILAIRNILGVNVLGDGRVVPVLNVGDLLEHAAQLKGKILKENTNQDTTEPITNIKHKILVVEDSLTSRSLLRNLLEAAGYEVKTSIDGTEAYAFLCSEPYDLVVSDIEMPRMNGFALTRKIRADEQLRSLPVVLVTSLESAEDRQKGLEAGANAYFIKSNFDQSGLMDVISRLI